MKSNPHFVPAPPPTNAVRAVDVWNMLGGEIDWSALPIVVELLGINDADVLIRDLIVIRDVQAKKRET